LRQARGLSQVIARFPEGEVKITNFAQIEDPIREEAQDD
jgi:hypothetical protein